MPLTPRTPLPPSQSPSSPPSPIVGCRVLRMSTVKLLLVSDSCRLCAPAVFSPSLASRPFFRHGLLRSRAVCPPVHRSQVTHVESECAPATKPRAQALARVSVTRATDSSRCSIELSAQSFLPLSESFPYLSRADSSLFKPFLAASLNFGPFSTYFW